MINKFRVTIVFDAVCLKDWPSDSLASLLSAQISDSLRFGLPCFQYDKSTAIGDAVVVVEVKS